MIDLHGSAVRTSKATIEVALFGSLNDSCHQAAIKDKYPGGGITYIRDPGAAQIFIEETMRPGNTLCLQVLMPWAGHERIVDPSHDKVEVYVNGHLSLELDVMDSSSQFIVIALTGSTNTGCRILP